MAGWKEDMSNKLSDESFILLRLWVISHEDDITHSFNDFGELKSVLRELIMGKKDADGEKV